MKLAVTYGRFNYLSKGHINFIETILRSWDEVYLVLLVNDPNIYTKINYDEDTNNFIEMCNSNVNKKEILPITHRLNAFSKAIRKNENLVGKVHLSVFCRPEVNVEHFNACYPDKYFDMVFPKDHTTEWDRKKSEKFRDVFFREIFTELTSFI